MTNKKRLTDKAADIDQDNISLLRQNKRLKLDVSTLKKRNTQLLERLDEAEARAEAFHEISEAEVRYSAYKRVASDFGGDTSAILILTDWHIEERIDRKTTNGLNRYTPKIAEERAYKAMSKFMSLVRSWDKFANIDHLVVGFLGDMITGYIHDELIESNYMSPTEACVLARDIMCNILQTLLDELKLPIDIVTCNGNHGRTTKRMQHKTAYKNSYEWLLFQTVAAEFKDHPQVTFHIGESYHNNLIVKGSKVRFHHGDSIRYQGGVGGISIPVNKAIAAWNKKNPADLDIFGHWHQYIECWNWVSCGCLIGYSEFALAIKADFQPPTQTMVLVSKQHGKVVSLPIFVE